MKIIKLAHKYFPSKISNVAAWSKFSLNNTRGKIAWNPSSFYPVNIQTSLNDQGFFRYNLVGTFKDDSTNRLTSYKMTINMQTEDFFWNDKKNKVTDAKIEEVVGGKITKIAELELKDANPPVSANDLLKVYIPSFAKGNDETEQQTPMEFVENNFNDILSDCTIAGECIRFNFNRLTRRRKQQMMASVIEFWIEFNEKIYADV